MNFLKIRSAVLFTTALLVSSLFCLSDVQAISASNIFITTAFNGQYIKGKGLPLKIVIENPDGKPVEGELKITGGLMEYGTLVNLEPYSIYEKWILAYPHAGSGLLLQFNAEGGYAFNKEVRTAQFISRKRLALYISKEKGNLSSFNSAFNNEDTFSELTPGELWDIWEGYKAADYVLLDAASVELMTASQLTALKGYVMSGGSLYISGSRYPEIYRQDFFQEILGTKGLGNVSLLSFDPADKSFQPFLSSQGGLWKFIDGQKRAMQIPADSSTEEAGNLFHNIVKWNTGYLVLLALIGFTWNKRYRRFLWPLLSILIVVASLASMGMINGKDRMRGISIININNDDEDAFLQSRLSLTSLGSTGMSAEFHGGFIYPADMDAGAEKIRVHETGITKMVTADLMMMGHKDLIWERFEKLEKPLNVDLEFYPEGVKGEIENISDYRLKEAFILMNGRFYTLPSIEAGHKISVNIIYEKDNHLPYPEGRQWLSKYILGNEEGMTSQGIKIVGLWEKPLLKLNKSGLIVEKEETFLLYHM